MPLNNVKVTNFKAGWNGDISDPDFTSMNNKNVDYNPGSYWNYGDTNELPRSIAIKIEPDQSGTEDGVNGYWGISSKDLTISGMQGEESGNWHKYGTYGGWLLGCSSCFAREISGDKHFEYDPIGKIDGFSAGSDWNYLDGSGPGGGEDGYTSGGERRMGYYFWKDVFSEAGNMTICGLNWQTGDDGCITVTYHPTGSLQDDDFNWDNPLSYYKKWIGDYIGTPPNHVGDDDAGDLWNDEIWKVYAINSKPLIYAPEECTDCPEMIPQPGNVVWIIVFFNFNTANSDSTNQSLVIQDIIDNPTFNIDLDGSPTFYPVDQVPQGMPVFGHGNNSVDRNVTTNRSKQVNSRSNIKLEFSNSKNTNFSNNKLNDKGGFDLGASSINP